jgi:L-threonylcarbamoyladenylate synthase
MADFLKKLFLCYYVPSMRVIRISGSDNRAAAAEVAGAIKQGKIVAFPTETFYGLGVTFSDKNALTKLFGLKRRPKDKPMPLIIGDVSTLSVVASAPDEIALRIIERFWPGPLTILFAAKEALPDLITGRTGKVAIRIPGRSFALDLAKAVGFPITATSANISGMPPAQGPDEVIRYFGDAIDIVVDGGRAPGEKPSTIIDVSEGSITLLRQGVVPYEDILAAARGQ